MEELNAKGGVIGRKVEVLFRDDQLKPAIGAQRTKELIENEKVDFVVGGLAAHVQMAINEQTKKAGVLFISVSQSDEISAKPDTEPAHVPRGAEPDHHDPRRGRLGGEERRQEVVDRLRRLRVGQAERRRLQEVAKKAGGTVLGKTPYPLGQAEFSAHLPKIQAAKPEALFSVTPGADNIAFLKQTRRSG